MIVVFFTANQIHSNQLENLMQKYQWPERIEKWWFRFVSLWMKVSNSCGSLPEGRSAYLTSQYGGAHPGSQWQRFRWSQTYQYTQGITFNPIITFCLSSHVCNDIKSLTPCPLHFPEQSSLPPYTFTSWHVLWKQTCANQHKNVLITNVIAETAER